MKAKTARLKLADVVRELHRMSEMLGSWEPPGHPDYISKGAASEWAAVLEWQVHGVAQFLEREAQGVES